MTRVTATPQKLWPFNRRDGRISQRTGKATIVIMTAQTPHTPAFTSTGERRASTRPPSSRMMAATPAARLIPIRKLKTSHRRRNGLSEIARDE